MHQIFIFLCVQVCICKIVILTFGCHNLTNIRSVSLDHSEVKVIFISKSFGSQQYQ